MMTTNNYYALHVEDNVQGIWNAQLSTDHMIHEMSIYDGLKQLMNLKHVIISYW